MRVVGLLLAGLLAACSGPQVRIGSASSVELIKTPFFAQDEFQCGPAALATVLVADGVETTPDLLESMVFLPGRQGSLQSELVAATRRHQRIAYPLDGGLDQILRELASGKPVLVLQNLGAGFWPVWHYAVVVGFDAARNEIILRSARDPRLVMSLSRFLRSWRLAQNWAMVVARPEVVPVTAQAPVWLRSAADLEALGMAELAGKAYAAAAARWPQEPLAWFAAGNAAYAQQDLDAAAQALRRAVLLAPQDAAARNNLAQVLMERGCRTDAESEIAIALQHARAEQKLEVERTRDAIQASSLQPARSCAPPLP